MGEASRSLQSYKCVQRRTTLSRSQIDRKVASGEFPRPVRLSSGRLAFVEGEVDDWIANRIAMRKERSAEVEVPDVA